MIYQTLQNLRLRQAAAFSRWNELVMAKIASEASGNKFYPAQANMGEWQLRQGLALLGSGAVEMSHEFDDALSGAISQGMKGLIK